MITDSGFVYFRVPLGYTNYINRILEGYEYLGTMTTLDRNGTTVVRSTVDTAPIVRDVLTSLQSEIPIEFLDPCDIL